MEEIYNYFRKICFKRGKLILIIIVVSLSILLIQIGILFKKTTEIMIIGSILSMIIILLANYYLRNGYIIDRAINNSFYNLSEKEEFAEEIDCELNNPMTQKYIDNLLNTFVFLTPSWCILITLNGSMICKITDIQTIERYFVESKGEFLLKINFFNGDSFISACEHIYEDLIEMINKRHI